jgi:3-phenylpropionate/trans-cinnamate dioxygenase ferredoxin subunit
MAKYIVATADEIPSGGRKALVVKGRPIVIFNREGEYFALLDRCPHSGAKLSFGTLIGVIEASQPGEFCRSRPGEMLKCPWHGWEFDIRTGQSWCDPDATKARSFDVSVEDACELSKGPFVAETFDVSQDGQYVVITI